MSPPARVRSFLLANGAWFYWLFVLLLLGKVLWGYWARDLTFGDTASYFRDASTWVRSGEVNIVWSPIYTAYFGYWLELLRDAMAATLIHRVALIALSTVLVAWLGYLTLPRVLAILLVVWWTAMPIHYDTLYAVHLFGALPIILLLLLWLKLPDRWRLPVCVALMLGTALLIRNEYLVLLVVLCATIGWRLMKGQELEWRGRMLVWIGPYVLCIGLTIVLVAAFYHFSYIKGEMIAAVSKPKHTLNMCQVYAFGYQQRHPEWTQSPWTECQGLMQHTFGQPLPSLSQMLIENPVAVVEHFIWNLRLFPSGLELLLFNVYGGGPNPDYVEAIRQPVYPDWALAALAGWIIFAAVAVARNRSIDYKDIRDRLSSLMPIFFGSGLMTIAVVLTQRPRPSYLLGVGVLLVWSFFMLSAAIFPRIKRWDLTLRPVVLALVALILVPSYASLRLPSKSGTLGKLYELAKPHREALCHSGRLLALNDYAYELSVYLCSPLRDLPLEGDVRILNLKGLLPTDRTNAEVFVDALRLHDVGAVVIDPSFFDYYTDIKNCAVLDGALRTAGWTLLAFDKVDDRRCIAYYTHSESVKLY